MGDKRAAPLPICRTVIDPGTRTTVDLPVADLYTHASLAMPVEVIHGARPGPVMFVSAAVHGDEINGVEIIRRLLQRRLQKSLKGTLLAIPVVNVHGFLDLSRYLPDRRDLNRSFPGSPKGSIASRLAYVFSSEIVQHADYGIDLHTGAIHRSNLPQIRANLADESALRLAKAFGTPIIIDAELREGSLRQHAASQGIPMLLYETGEALRFDEIGIRAGVRGILNVMRAVGMLPEVKSKRNTDPVIAQRTSWVRASQSGVVNAAVKLGQRVTKEQTLATICDPFDAGHSAVVRSPLSGVVVGCNNLPLAHEGEALFNIAIVDGEAEEAERMVARFQDEHTGEDPTKERESV